jgi:hypothetical protein
MASVNTYKKFGEAEAKTNKLGGYKNVLLWAPLNTFASVASPVGTTALGDKFKITAAHTFPADEGWISFLSKLNSVTLRSEAVGEGDAARTRWIAEGTLFGDSAAHQEQLEAARDLPGLFLLKDGNCIDATAYIQLGDACTQPTFSFTFTGNTTAEGMKEYRYTISVLDKRFFYSGAVTEKP